MTIQDEDVKATIASGKSKTKNTPKKFRERGIQAYYTKHIVAYALSRLIAKNYDDIQSVLDPSGGLGHLLSGFKSYFPSSNIQLSMIEPCAPYDDDKPFCSLKNHLAFYHMSFEEWCITYGENEKFDLVFANPPFNERIGSSALGESLTEMFQSDVLRFESLFFLACSKIAKKYMAFIVPDSYFFQKEALPVLNYLASSGWNLVDIRSLPLDACMNANECMSFLLFERGPVFDWPLAALELVYTRQVQPLLKDAEIKTVPGRHGAKTGYLLPKSVTAAQLSELVELNKSFIPSTKFECSFHDCFPFKWEPSPKAIGATWNRLGVFYELSDYGWVLANGPGYADGLPVNDAFEVARNAFDLHQIGAINSAYAMVAPLDLDALKREYRDISAASFLSLLSKGPVVDAPMVADLENLGVLEGPFSCPNHPDIERVDAFLVHKRTISGAQACRLFLDVENLPAWLREKALVSIRDQYIPADKISLRAPWIPRALIADYLGWELDTDGLYVGDNWALQRYLNYGRDGGKITETDQEEFLIASQHFAIAMNDHDDRDFSVLRSRVHAHFLIYSTPKRVVQEAFRPVACAKPLHPWQTDDIDFYLSGATVSNLDTGLGKTLTALMAAVVHCSGGSKALITVPKQVLSKWLETLNHFFPTVRGEILGFVENSKGTMVRLPREELTAQAQSLFFDPSIQIILTSHQVFGEFKVSPEDRAQADLENAYDQIGDGINSTRVKARAVFVKQAGRRTYRNGGEITFSDLPKGLLVVIDEAHNFKGLFGMPYSGWGESLIMCGQCGESKRAYDMQVKLDITRARGGKTLALTATMINNSVAEIYNMLRIFAPQALYQRSLRNTQQLMDFFCIIDSITSVSLTGNIKTGQTITGFYNVQELQNMWQSCMITKTANDVGLALPTVHEVVERIQPTEVISDYMDYWKDMLMVEITKDQLDTATSKDGNDKEKETVGILRIISMLDKVASYPPQCAIKDNPKFERLASNVLKHFELHNGQQIIFADEKQVQNALADYLTDLGIPRDQIVVINADTAPGIKQRLEISKAFNKGLFRVAIGGKVISEGIDLQENTVAAHFLNLSWEGGTIHQRKGRLVRQGNQNAEVYIYYYLLSGSTDDYRYLTITNKTHWGDLLRETQCENLTQGVFSDPVDDDMLCSLAKDPVEMKTILMDKKKSREILGQAEKAERLLKKMLSFANPKCRTHALEILQKYEAKLRGLECIPESVVNEGIFRVRVMAHLHYRRIKNHQQFRNWDRWVKDDDSLIGFMHDKSFSINAFTLRVLGDVIMFEFETLEEYVKPDLLIGIPDFEGSFGEVNPVFKGREFAQVNKRPALDIVVVDPANRRAQVPVIQFPTENEQTKPGTALLNGTNNKETSKRDGVKVDKGQTVGIIEPSITDQVKAKPAACLKPWPIQMVQPSLFDPKTSVPAGMVKPVAALKPWPKKATQLSLFNAEEITLSKAS